MLKVRIEKEDESKSLKSETDVWYFDSDEEFGISGKTGWQIKLPSQCVL